jgi:hypothetical protein
VRYAITPLTTIAVTAGYEEQTFKESHIRDVTRYTLGPTVEFSPEAAIHGRVVTAFELFRPEDPALAETKGLAYEAVLNWSLYGRTTFDFGAGRNISYSYQDAEPFYRLTSVRLLVTQPVSDRFELYASGDWEHMGYQWRRDPLADETYRVDILQTGSAGVGIHLGHGFRVKLGIEKARRKSVEDPLQNFTRTRMLSTVTVGS